MGAIMVLGGARPRLHAGFPRQELELVQADLAPVMPPDLLKSHHISLQRLDDGRDSARCELGIDADAAMDIIGRYAEGGQAGRRGSRPLVANVDSFVIGS